MTGQTVEREMSSGFLTLQNRERFQAVLDAEGMIGRELSGGAGREKLEPYVRYLQACLSVHFRHAGEPGWTWRPLDDTLSRLAAVDPVLHSQVKATLDECFQAMLRLAPFRHFGHARDYSPLDRARAAEAYGIRLSELMGEREKRLGELAARLVESKWFAWPAIRAAEKACRALRDFLQEPSPHDLAVILGSVLMAEASDPRDLADTEADRSIEAVRADFERTGFSAEMEDLGERIRQACLGKTDSFSLGLDRAG